MNSKLLLAAVITIGVGAVLRFVNLNSLPVFVDESIYVRWSQVMQAESSLRFLPLSDGKQPLYMWTLMPLLRFFSDPLIAGRVLSAVTGLGTILGVGIAAYLLFKSTRAGVVSAAIYATVPYAVFFDRMALADGMLTMWLVWTFVFVYLAIRHLRFDAAMLAGFCLGFAWLTKSPAIFGFGLVPAMLLLAEPKKIWRAAVILVPTLVIAFGMYNILRLGPEFHMIAIRNKDYIYPIAEILTHPRDPLLPHLRDVVQFYVYLATPIGLLLAVWGIFSGQWEHWRNRAVLAFWWLAPVIVQSAIAKTLTARYLLFTLPFMVILATHAIEHIGEKTKKRRLAWAMAGLFVLFGLGEAIVLIANPAAVPLPRIERAGYLEQWTAGTGLKEASQYIREAAQTGPVIVGSEGFFGTPFSALQMYLNDVPQVRVIGVGVWIDKVSPDLIKATVENQVFLVVNSSRFHIAKPEKEKLTLIASYPKAVSPSGEVEYLLLFKLEK
ncbi:MAG: glycosyltransferase family 39 protein [bacterium]|nr:glycosyltransferase family 39 protein [bacterium]